MKLPSFIVVANLLSNFRPWPIICELAALANPLLPLLYRYTPIQTSTWWQSTYYLFILYPSFTAAKKLSNRLRSSSSSSLLSAIDPISYWFSITGTLAYFPTMRPTPCNTSSSSSSSIFAVRSNLSTFTIIGSDLLLALLLYIKPSASARCNNKTWATEREAFVPCLAVCEPLNISLLL